MGVDKTEKGARERALLARNLGDLPAVEKLVDRVDEPFHSEGLG